MKEVFIQNRQLTLLLVWVNLFALVSQLCASSLEDIKSKDPSMLVRDEAGKHGFLTIDPKSQHLVFEDGTSSCFYGVNFAEYFNEPDRKISTEEMDHLLDAMKAMGVNVIRAQSYDDKIQKGQYPDGLNSVALENRDRFIAEAKKRGIYFHMTLNLSGEKGGAYALYKPASGDREMLILVDELIENQKKYAKAILNHVNPFTGLAYKDEPAIISLQLGNEQHAYSRPQWQNWSSFHGPYGDEVQGKWNQFLLKKYGSREKLQDAWKNLLSDQEDPAKGTVKLIDAKYPTWKNNFTRNTKEEDIILFGDEMQNHFHTMMRSCIRDEIGDKKHLISDNGWIRGDDRICATAHRNLDLMDLQHYWPHGIRSRVSDEHPISVSPIKDCGISILASMLTAREYHGEKKPSFVTEYNSHKDNAYLFQLIPVHAAFAKLIGIDGVALWCYSSGEADIQFNKDHWFSFERNSADLDTQIIPFLIGSYLFRTSIPELIDQKTLSAIAKPDASNSKGLSVDYDASLQQKISTDAFVNKDAGITVDFANNSMFIDRDDTVFYTGHGPFKGNLFSFQPVSPNQDYLFAVFPVDGKKLSESKQWRVFTIMNGEMNLKRQDLKYLAARTRGYKDIKPGENKTIEGSVWTVKRPKNAAYFDISTEPSSSKKANEED